MPTPSYLFSLSHIGVPLSWLPQLNPCPAALTGFQRIMAKEQYLTCLVFPVSHPLVQWLRVRWSIKDVQFLFLKRSIRRFGTLAIPLPRYRAIETLARRVDGLTDLPYRAKRKFTQDD